MHRVCNIPNSICTSYIEAIISDIEDVTAHIEATTAHTATVTAHNAPGTIKAPFEYTTTAHEKMAKPFLRSIID